MDLVKFLVSTAGRIMRIVAGMLLIAAGFVWAQGALTIILVAVGLIPLTAGLFDFCVFAPLFGMPFWGKQVREA